MVENIHFQKNFQKFTSKKNSKNFPSPEAWWKNLCSQINFKSRNIVKKLLEQKFKSRSIVKKFHLKKIPKSRGIVKKKWNSKFFSKSRGIARNFFVEKNSKSGGIVKNFYLIFIFVQVQGHSDKILIRKFFSKSRGMRSKSRSIGEKILSKKFLSPGAWWKTCTSKKNFQVQGHSDKILIRKKKIQVQRHAV